MEYRQLGKTGLLVNEIGMIHYVDSLADWETVRTGGSNSSFRSRGTDTSTSPKLVCSVLLLCPFRL